MDFDTIMAHNMPQMFHLYHCKGTFGILNKQVEFLKDLQNFIYMLKMNLPSFTTNQYIIEEDKDTREKIRA